MQATSSELLDRFMLPPMKFKLFIGAVAVAMLVLAVGGWALDGMRWAMPRPRHAV